MKDRKASKEKTDRLPKILREQRKEILEYLESAAYAIEEKTNIKRPMRFNIETLNLERVERVERELSQSTRADISNVYLVLSSAALRSAASASRKATKAVEQGHSAEALKHCIRAERSIGAALALAQIEKVESAIAKAKAKRGHRSTYALQRQLLDYYDKNIDPKLPASKAATIILKRFPTADPNKELVQYRTLVKWISAHKKRRKIQLQVSA